MENQISNNKRIAKNTVFLYFRLLITVAVGLYTSRVVLATLGISDYGLYNVVGGFVALLAFINLTLTNGTQRFISYALGEGNNEKLKLVFSNALLIHVLIASIVLVLSEVIGPWFISTQMNIPEGREVASQYVYQFSVIAFIVSILQVPFMSALVAHEKMDIYAYMSIYDVVMKLLIVFFIQVVDCDKLILYAGLFALVQISDACLYALYCRRKYTECRIKFSYDKQLFKELVGFSSWNLVGALGCSANGQGVNILLNIFWGTIVNAARGIAFQVNGILVSFSRNFQIAANPQIIKLYADKKVEEMTNLAIQTAKYSGFLMIFLMLPFLIDIEYILKLWLGNYPELAPVFLRIILVQSLIQTLSGPPVTVTHASGMIKMPNLTSGIILLLFLPITYIALKLGASPVMVFIINVIPWFFECYFDTYYAQKYTGFSQKRFYKEVYVRVFLVLIVSFLSVYLLNSLLCFTGFLNFAKNVFLSIIIVSLFVYTLGLRKDERIVLSRKINSILLKIRHKNSLVS